MEIFFKSTPVFVFYFLKPVLLYIHTVPTIQSAAYSAVEINGEKKNKEGKQVTAYA